MVEFSFSDMWQFYFDHPPPNHLPRSYFDQKNAKKHLQMLISSMIEHYTHISPSRVVNVGDFPGKSIILYFVGDIHGNYTDLHRIISFFIDRINNWISRGYQVRIIFLGDYVDRNKMDLHALILLLLFNLKFPHNVLLLRGNHEERETNKQYGFRRTVLSRFSYSLYMKIQKMFATFPLVGLISIAERFTIFAVHGGIPINLENPECPVEIRSLELAAEKTSIKHMDLYSQQLLWNDPSETLPHPFDFYPNRFRGGTFFEFNENVFSQFMAFNQFDLMVRGHTFFPEGYQYYFHRKLLSLFSTTEYMDQKIDGKICQITFEEKGSIDAVVQLLSLNDLGTLD